MELRPYLFHLSFCLLYFFLPPFEDNGLLFWVPDVLCLHSEVVLWNFLSVVMFFWWICWGERGLPIVFLCHLPELFCTSLVFDLLFHLFLLLFKLLVLILEGAVLRWQRNRMGRPLSPPQIHQKNIWTLSKFHKTTSECWQRTSGTQKSSPLSLKGGKKKYKR